MQSITVSNDDPIFPAVLALVSGGEVEAPSTKPKRGKKPDLPEDEFEEEEDDDEEEDGDVSQYSTKSRKELKKMIRERGIMSRVSNSISDEKLIQLLEESDKNSGDDEEEDDDDEMEDDDEGSAGEAEDDEVEDDDEEDDEDSVEVGMQVKATIAGKQTKCKVTKIDYEEGKVIVEALVGTKKGKKFKVSPAKLTKA